MSSFCLGTRLVLLFSVIICMECAIANKPIRNKHAHNMIHKEDKSSNDTIVDVSDEDSVKTVTSIDHPDISTPEDDIVESANRRRTSLKITIPLHHQQEKKLSSIKHPLPKGMHDIMPHEPSRQGIMNQHKVHHDFLIHEGPKLQRRLHHHFTLEEIRQRRKELREKLQAKRKKMSHVTPYAPLEKNEEILMMPMQTTEKITLKGIEGNKGYSKKNPLKTQKQYILQKEKEYLEPANRLKYSETSISKDSTVDEDKVKDRPTTEFLLLNHLKNLEEEKLATTIPVTPPTHYIDFGTLISENKSDIENFDDSNLKSEFKYNTKTDDTTKKQLVDPEAQSQMLLGFLRKKYRFSSKLNHEATTPSMETTLIEKNRNISHEKLMSHLKYTLGEREDNVTSTESVLLEPQYESPEETTISEQDTATRNIVDVTSPAVYISKIKKLYASSTLKPQENSTGVIEEPGMYQDWRARLRKAIKYRLHKLNEDSESEKERTN